MKKRLFIIGGVILLCIISCIIFFASKSWKESYEIVVQTNGGVYYYWEYEISDDIVSIKETSKARDNLMGGVVDITYTVTPKKKGDATLILNYVSGADKSVSKTQKYKVIVSKNLKVMVINSSKNIDAE